MSTDAKLIPDEQNRGFDIEEQVEAAKTEDEAIEFHVHGVDEKPLFWQGEPVVIGVYGSHSETYRKVEKQIRGRKLKRSSFTMAAQFSETIEKAAGATAYWKGVVSKGVPVPFTSANAAKLYDRCPWLLEQVLEAQTDHISFFSKRSTVQSKLSENGQSGNAV